MTCPAPTHDTGTAYSKGCRCPAAKLAAFRRKKRWEMIRRASGGRTTMDATGTARRLQGLAVMGWPSSTLGGRLGISSQRLTQIRLGQHPSVFISTAKRVDALYDELCMTKGPAPRAATWARRRGWPPPLAWDDDTIDDPAAKPNYGLNVPDKGRTIQELIGLGLTPAGIAERLGIKEASVKRYLAPSRSAA